jgi:hypothetical protein
MLVWLLFLWCEESLHLKSGELLVCDNYRVSQGRVLLWHRDELYGLPAEEVDWPRTFAEREARAKASESGGGEPESDSGGGAEDAARLAPNEFMIQKLDVRETSLIDLLRFLADMVGFNLYIDRSVSDRNVTYLLKQIPWRDALALILTNAGLDYDVQQSFIHVRGGY